MNHDTMEDAGQAAADPRIDRALRSVGSATPAPGFEGRILTRLAAERIAPLSKPRVTSWIGRVPLLPRQILGLGTACLLGIFIVAGSVSHSHRMVHGVAPPAIPLAGQGIGAASAVHPAAPASTPAPAGEPGRAPHSSEQGRARIAPHARKAPGAVPAPPANKGAGKSQ